MPERPETQRPLALVVIGVSGSGKSTVGQRLATALDADFLEGDDFHPPANIAKMCAGTPLDDADRWPWLAAIGRAIGEKSESGKLVIAACSALRHAYRKALIDAADRDLTFVHLAVDAAALKSRMQARRQHFMPASLLESQLATLEPLCADESGTEIREIGTIETTVDAILRWLQANGYEKGRP